ncbi:MAG: TlpA family protein disulfide reductase [Bacteroidales bacterium]|nr:TlpA family protein disulfide reductase [Bacteroidales bacterium]
MLLVICALLPPAACGAVRVHGAAPSHSGDQLRFYIYSDYITATEREVGRCTVADDGHFECPLQIDETCMVMCHLGVYRAYFFAEPGRSYELALPPKEAKTEAQRLNPFFREVDMQLGVVGVGPDELNFLINAFDLRFNEHFDQLVRDAYLGRSRMNIDSLIARIDARFEGATHPFFNDYRRYRYGLLKQVTRYQKSKTISDEYFLRSPVRYANPAYMELFNMVYDKYFFFFSNTPQGKTLGTDISRDKSLEQLRRTLGNNQVLANDTLKEMVIMKGLFDEFFNDDYSRSALLDILGQLYRSVVSTEHYVIVENIRSRITRLLPGFVPTPFELADTSGRLVSLDQFEGRYVYLNFCATSSYTCIQEFALLQQLYGRHSKHLEIVTVLTDDNREDISRFLRSTGYSWTFLHYGNRPEVIKDYDVRAYPTYYLIGPDQKLVMSPAVSPQEGFEARLFQHMRRQGEI